MPPASFQQAVLLYQQRRLPESERLLGQILQRASGDVGALHLAGLIAQETGRLPRALSLLSKAVKLSPRAAPLLDALAGVLNDLGQKQEALAQWDKATQADPAFPDAWVNRGTLLKGLNCPAEAVDSYDRALAIEPNFAEAHYNRALALGQLRRLPEALDGFDRTIALNPGFVEAHVGRGTILAGLQRHEEAMASFRRAMVLRPDHAEAHYNIGTSLLSLGRTREAIAFFDKAIALRPDHADAYHNRGLAQEEQGLYEQALASQEKAQALRQDFDFLEGDLLQLRLTVCDWRKPDTSMLDRIERGDRACAPFAALLAFDDPASQQKTATTYTAAKYPADGRLGPIAPRSAGEKIRIGYFSADFREHPVSRLIVGLLENHDRSCFHTIGFAFGPPVVDTMSERIAAACDEFVDLREMSDEAAARLAREKEIDIAVDLGGHTKFARPGIFAFRAAPAQVNYIGYLGTMGADYIDYIVADPIIVPENDRAWYTEKVASLPSFQSNPTDRTVSAAPVSRADAGLPGDGFVFCCFNNNFKILPDTFAGWVRILKAVPSSVLWLYITGDAAERNIRASAAAAGLSPDRIVFARRVPPADYLARLTLADLFLDTAPYNAGTTASDALWMGLPVLTRLGKTFAGRMGASLLTAIGLPELIAPSADAYEAMAIALANDPGRLGAIKRKLREQRATARLFDTKQFARDIESAYTIMTQRVRDGLPPDHIVVTPSPTTDRSPSSTTP